MFFDFFIFFHFLSFSFIFFHFLSFSFILLGAQNLIFLGINFVTISLDSSEVKNQFLAHLGRYSFGPSFPFFLLFFSFVFFVFFLAFYFFIFPKKKFLLFFFPVFLSNIF